MASDCVHGDVPQTHTDIYIYILSCARLSCVGCCCCCCRCRLVVSVCVLGMGRCCPHTRYSGLCCCLLLALPPFIGRRGCAYYGMRSIQLCRVCAWTILSYLVCVCVCVCVCVPHTHTPTHTHTHTHATPNSLVTHHTTHIAYEQSRMHSKGNIYMCVRTRAQYMHLYLQRSLSLSLMRERERESVVNLYYFPASSRATVPAEFKHINKRRKRNQQGFP
jgi:hypothetical protein